MQATDELKIQFTYNSEKFSKMCIKGDKIKADDSDIMGSMFDRRYKTGVEEIDAWLATTSDGGESQTKIVIEKVSLSDVYDYQSVKTALAHITQCFWHDRIPSCYLI